MAELSMQVRASVQSVFQMVQDEWAREINGNESTRSIEWRVSRTRVETNFDCSGIAVVREVVARGGQVHALLSINRSVAGQRYRATIYEIEVRIELAVKTAEQAIIAGNIRTLVERVNMLDSLRLELLEAVVLARVFDVDGRFPNSSLEASIIKTRMALNEARRAVNVVVCVEGDASRVVETRVLDALARVGLNAMPCGRTAGAWRLALRVETGCRTDTLLKGIQICTAVGNAKLVDQREVVVGSAKLGGAQAKGAHSDRATAIDKAVSELDHLCGEWVEGLLGQ